MTIDVALCTRLAQAADDHGTFVQGAVAVGGAQALEPLPGSKASVVMRFEVLHQDARCGQDLADACVLIVADDPDTRFVAPDDAAADNYVSYWQERVPPTAGIPGWDLLSGGQVSRTGRVRILAQTLPAQIAVPGGAGYLHHDPHRPGDGWTVTVGVLVPAGAASRTFQVSVSARPDWSRETGPMPISLPE